MNEIDKKLYELFASKKLTVGCKLLVQIPYKGEIIMDYTYGDHSKDLTIGYVHVVTDTLSYNVRAKEVNEILGHEPTITDIFIVAKEKGVVILVQTKDFTNYYIGIAGENLPYIEIPYNPTLQIMNQEENTKKQLIELFDLI